MPDTRPTTQYEGLTPAEAAAARVDPHIPTCDEPFRADCISCSARITTIRRIIDAVRPELVVQQRTTRPGVF